MYVITRCTLFEVHVRNMLGAVVYIVYLDSLQ